MTHHEYQEVYTRPNGTKGVRTINADPTLTQQQFREECDINNIIKKHTRTGELTHVSQKLGSYLDVSEITDYQSMLQSVQNAQDAFMALPASTRARFRNDPGELLAFIQNDSNYDEAVSLGLIDKKPDEPKINETKTNKNAKSASSKNPQDSEESK